MALLQSCTPRVEAFASQRRPAPLRARQCSHLHAARVVCMAEREDRRTSGQLLGAAAAGVIASGLLWLAPAPAKADVQMVAPQMVTQLARPLPKQTVDKGKIWTVFCGGASVLFVGSVLVENNPAWFPAISRANVAMKEASKRMKEEEERAAKEEELLRLRQQEFIAQQRQVAAVEAGLKQAKAKVLANSAASTAAAQQPAAATTSAPAPAAAAAAAVAAAQAHAAADAAAPASRPAAAEAAADHNGASAPAPAPAPAAAPSTSGFPYVVVQDAVPDMGAVAWPASSGGAAASDAPAVAAAAAEGEEDAEALARKARLQSFVADTASMKASLEALQQRQ